jgi:TATA-box binding protein (TBP) (component of TFIID and TFIIIB)
MLMSKINWEDFKYINIIDHEKNEIKDLPDGLTISTMCASAKLNSLVNIVNIEKYLQLDQDDIICVKLNNDNKRTLIQSKIKNKRLKKKEKKEFHFFNQITVVVRVFQGPVTDWEDEPKINLKLFKNGSIQMSGCKSLEYVNIVLNKLLVKIKQIKAKIEDNKIHEIKFVENHTDLAITSYKIDMINSNYKVNMQIDRIKFYNLLLKKKIKCSFEPCIRACVIIKYTPIENNDEEKEISVFVFQKGNIIITGARTKNHIISACKYINNILLTHHDEISKKDDKEEEDLILKLHNAVLKENSITI